ncbi:hypothetical protein [Streptosporangium pseudovulgare]|uniref:Uncharacterized protein n=1 Tax=Streptosporangium pseudovulgare TaxID=35765 RepID=A0ABQ2QLL5_9ACTN|nr:hypothetical protein [Streptosporangium pseudovulgare]GGP86144.1 hypothetical protein GCM10010140_14470 [Streptosporangium pseudovulgare]
MAKPAVGVMLCVDLPDCGLGSLWWFPCRDRRIGCVLIVEFGCDVVRCGLGLVGVPPGVEEVVVGDGDDERDEQRLGDTAVCGPVLGFAEVGVEALQPAVDLFGVGPNGLAGPDSAGLR